MPDRQIVPDEAKGVVKFITDQGGTKIADFPRPRVSVGAETGLYKVGDELVAIIPVNDNPDTKGVASTLTSGIKLSTNAATMRLLDVGSAFEPISKEEAVVETQPATQGYEPGAIKEGVE